MRYASWYRGTVLVTACGVVVLAGCGSTRTTGPNVTHATAPASTLAGPVATQQAGPGGTASAPAGTEPPGGDDDATTTSVPAAQAPPAATAFAAAWARPGLPAATWWAQLAPLCVPRFAAQLRSTDPANVPASRVTGPPVATREPVDGLAVYAVPTDAGTLSVTLTSVGGHWLASTNDFTPDTTP